MLHEISDVATDPDSVRVVRHGAEIVVGTRDGVVIRVVIRTGEVVTGHPINLPRNLP